MAKQEGTIATHFKYDSFGSVTSGDTSKTRYLFTGREFDTATKLQYNRARYYAAAVGRWSSEDPLGLAAGIANDKNYLANFATGATDPSGLLEDWDFTPGDYEEFVKKGGQLRFGKDSDWLPKPLQENLKATIEFVLGSHDPRRTKGINLDDF